ncbi:outer dense fiber protein 4 [Nycticebus coucang]|uniref:outer dense fiber protein 4 n=1 Tax=Nycticebus coucang TaxID=9470 RepID=UPI00234D07E3|nr:outer dense fiber protein 4 [Nycticebus coucang]
MGPDLSLCTDSSVRSGSTSSLPLLLRVLSKLRPLHPPTAQESLGQGERNARTLRGSPRPKLDFANPPGRGQGSGYGPAPGHGSASEQGPALLSPLLFGFQRPRADWRLPADHRRASLLPFHWRITHSSRWIAQVLASELSLVALVLLLVMVFSKKWLYPSGSRYYQRWPRNVSNRIYTSAHIMSLGLLHFCKSRSCSNLDNEIVTFIFFTLLLFPINLWIFELEGNISIPIGWSYFIGWLVFVLYVTCAILCHFNHKSFWRLILSHPSEGATSSGSNSSLIQESPSKQAFTDSSLNQEEALGTENKSTHP